MSKLSVEKVVSLVDLLETMLPGFSQDDTDTNESLDEKIDFLLQRLGLLESFEKYLEFDAEIGKVQQVLFAFSKRDFSQKLEISEEYNNLDALKLTINIHGEELEDMLDMLEEHNKLKDKFLANVSHEIRTPLTAIIGFSELLSDANLGGEASRYVHAIERASADLLSLINELLDFAKIESNQMLVNESLFSISSFVEKVDLVFGENASKKGLVFEASLASEIPDFLIGDVGKINQILTNLLGNALKFTSEGSVRLSCELEERNEDSCWVKFQVVDSGIGIEPNSLKLIFDRFRQGNSNTSRLFGGTGLGLSITKELVDLLGGTLEMSSELGQGTTVKLLLPLKVGEAPEVVENKESGVEGYLFENLLLVEDNPFNQILAQKFLAERAMNIELAENGKEAIEKLTQNSYDLVLLDIQMPVMDGYECLEVIRNQLKLDVPVVAVSASATVAEKKRCEDLGVNAFLSKPYNRKMIELLLDSYRTLKQEV